MSPEHYVRSTIATAMGWPDYGRGGGALGEIFSPLYPPALEPRLLAALTGSNDLDAAHPYGSAGAAQGGEPLDLHDELAASTRLTDNEPAGGDGPRITLARWPVDRPFALFLSHDIDQIHDRELWRVLADVNHMRRVWQYGEPGSAMLAARRVARALFRPKPATKDYDTILEIEKRHGFRSTFFVLHDRYWARQGARFSIQDPEIQAIVHRAKDAGCEVTVHGGYYRFNNAALYRQSRDEVGRVFGVQPVGIRNHLLRYSYPGTWRAQVEAGFQYDATYGYNCRPGPRSGLALPFFAYDRERQQELDLLVLPLTVMDTTVYRYLRLQGQAALDFTWASVERYAGHGALVTLLWHGNFFNEPEYWDWQLVYEQLLQRLDSLKPWCATGAEINCWWRARAAVRIAPWVTAGEGWRTRVETGEDIADLVLRLLPGDRIGEVTVEVKGARVERDGARTLVRLPKLRARQTVDLRIGYQRA